MTSRAYVAYCALLAGAALPMSAARAQCPDGSPPPCRTVERARKSYAALGGT